MVLDYPHYACLVSSLYKSYKEFIMTSRETLMFFKGLLAVDKQITIGEASKLLNNEIKKQKRQTIKKYTLKVFT